MKNIEIEKITLNIGTGKPGPELEKAKILLEKITGAKPCETITKKRLPAWSLRPGLVIGCKVTIRGSKAEELLKTLLKARDNNLPVKVFDKKGNFSFGIKEYLDIPNINYIPEVGIIGLEVAVSLQRKGFRVKRRGLETKKIPARHDINKLNGIEFAKKIGIHVIEKEEAEE